MVTIPAYGDGCDLDRLEPETSALAEVLSSEFPDIVWTRGASCARHNAEVGGSPTSGHLAEHGITNDFAIAIDGTVDPCAPWRVRLICHRAIQHGEKGVGIHLPTRLNRKPQFHFDRKPRIQLMSAARHRRFGPVR